MFFNKEETRLSTLESAADYESAINGVYGLLTASFSRYSFLCVNVKGDNLMGHWPYYSNFYSRSDLCEDINNEIIDYDRPTIIWINTYKTIASINNIINQYKKNDNNEKIKGIIGEAYLIRAYCYLRLTRTYRQIPLIENTDVDYSIP